jgi:hypothetical protein
MILTIILSMRKLTKREKSLIPLMKNLKLLNFLKAKSLLYLLYFQWLLCSLLSLQFAYAAVRRRKRINYKLEGSGLLTFKKDCNQQVNRINLFH